MTVAIEVDRIIQGTELLLLERLGGKSVAYAGPVDGKGHEARPAVRHFLEFPNDDACDEFLEQLLDLTIVRRELNFDGPSLLDAIGRIAGHQRQRLAEIATRRIALNKSKV